MAWRIVPGRAAIDRAPGLGIDGAFDPRQRDPMAARVTVSRARRAVAGMAPVTSRREHRTITLGPRGALRLAHAEHASIVVCGHSHVPFMGRDRGLVIFNPGSIGPRRFLLPIVFGVIDVARDGIALRHVDCETGATWQPP